MKDVSVVPSSFFSFLVDTLQPRWRTCSDSLRAGRRDAA